MKPSNETRKYIEEWSFGVSGVPADTMPPLPSDNVIKELGQYLPDGKVTLYRAQRYGVVRNNIESWTTERGMANFIADEMKQRGIDTTVIKTTVTKNDILSYNPKLPKDWDILESEVIVVRGDLKNRMNKLRKQMKTGIQQECRIIEKINVFLEQGTITTDIDVTVTDSKPKKKRKSPIRRRLQSGILGI